jgi:phosphate ABC transporter phosphate-binding protein
MGEFGQLGLLHEIIIEPSQCGRSLILSIHTTDHLNHILEGTVLKHLSKLILPVAVGVLLSGCGSENTGSGATGTGGAGKATGMRINGGGATFILPMMSKWTGEYDKAKGVKVNYQSIGSGGGIQQMTAKIFDFGCTDGPMNDEQLKKAHGQGGDVVHIPLVMGAVAMAYNLEEVKEPLIFSGEAIADIFLGKIKKWNDPILQKLNPKETLPDKEIMVIHRSDGSGTTYIFSDYLSKVSPGEWKKEVGVGTSLKWPVGSGQKGSEGVAGQVTRSAGSIGYVELTYALQNKIAFGLVINKEGMPVKPDLQSVTAAAAGALESIPDDLRYSITNAPGKNAYPISGTTWAVLYVNQPADKGKAVVDFLRWCTHEGQQYTDALDYARLPEGLVKRVEKKLDEVKVGQ